MKHICKEQWMGCAVAAAAMISNRGYREVGVHWPQLDEALMRHPGQFCSLLEAVTDTPWQLSPCWDPQPTVLSFSYPVFPVCLFIHDKNLRPQFGQWIVVSDRIVHDPGEPQAHGLTRYPRRDWFVETVVQPARPDELACYRARHRGWRLLNLLFPDTGK